MAVLDAENFSLSVQTDSDSQGSAAFDLRLWKRLPKFIDGIGIPSVELVGSV